VLGNGGGDAVKPTRVGGSVSFVDIAGGGQHFCALDASGRLHCWGDNYVGQLGNGLGGDRGLPGVVQFP
jgi:alpha-tubulin suppressor-like RCC1 family protein